jgi:REP element-mobilizing transposase RayT
LLETFNDASVANYSCTNIIDKKRMIRQKNYPNIRKKLWGAALWSPIYSLGSCGGAPIAVIRQYIEQQQTPH